MIPVSIESIIVGMLPQPSVIALRPQKGNDVVGSDTVLPIWIGPTEATAIGAALEEKDALRPLTHALLADVIRSLGGSLSRAVIDRVEGTTFFSTLYLRGSNGMISRVDARPSDAIALAVRAEVPVFVEEDVFTAAGYPLSFRPGESREIEMEEFHKFIEEISPEDFASK